MKKVIAIVCHEVTNPLIHTIKYMSMFSENIVIVHVDMKCALQGFLFLESPNVIFIENRVSVKWGGVTQIIATLNLMECASNIDYDYFFLISGDDIPTMSNQKINDCLLLHFGEEFIHYQDKRNFYVEPVNRVKYKYPGCFFNRRVTFPNRIRRRYFNFTKDFFYLNEEYVRNKSRLPKFYKGTNWFTLTKSSVDFILGYLDGNRWFINLFKNSLCGDEIFFHTILKSNEKIKIHENREAMNNALRYIDWISGPQYPKILTGSDINNIIKSQSFFARKIDVDADADFMNKFIK